MKKIRVLIIAIGFILAVTACGQNKDTAEKVTEQPTTVNTTAQVAEKKSHITKLEINKEVQLEDIHKVKVSVNKDENDVFQQIDVLYDGKSLSIGDCYAYTLSAYAVHMSNDNTYLYLRTISDNDYSIMIIVDLNKDKLAEAGRLGGTGFHGGWSNEKMDYAEEFTNPDSFIMDTRVEILSTMTGECTYHVDENTGMPVMEAPYYTISTESEFVLTAKQSVKVKVLPDMKEGSVEKGTTFKLLRTDGKSYVEALMNDGRECRIEVEKEDWRSKVNGKYAEDVFDGMMYAG